MKAGLPALQFEPAMVAAVVVKPQPKKEGRHEEAVDDRRRLKLEHPAETLSGRVAGAKRRAQGPGVPRREAKKTRRRVPAR
jgi:hypothetical protein